jgi:hypothetical protein
MSTKTTFKRIALVTVAALGFGVMSVAPSSAATNSKIQCEVADGLAAGANTLGTTTTNDACNAVAGAFNYVTLKIASDADNVITSTTKITAASAVAVVSADGLSAVTAGAGNIQIATPVAGTVTVSYWVRTGGVLAAAALETVTITVNAAAVSGVASTAKSLSYLVAGESTTAITDVVAAADATVSAAATYNATAKATIKIKLLDGLSAAVKDSLTATISSPTGAGSISNSTSPTANVTATTATVNNSGLHFFYVHSNGVSGVATIAIKSGTTTLFTETVTFVGLAASYSVALADATVATGVNVPVAGTVSYKVTAKDAAGNTVVDGSTVYAYSATTANATVAVSGNTTSGVATIAVTGVAAGTSVITFGNAATLASSTVTATTTVEVTKSTAKTVTVTLDKDSYEPGEKMLVKVTATDSNGKGVADGARALFAADLVANFTLSGSANLTGSATPTLLGGSKTYTIYAPAIPGNFTITGTEGAATDTVVAAGTAATITAKATITNAALTAAQEATDAANEATDAGNNAKDAADQAIEAADAATIAAQDAAAAAEAAGEMAVEAAEAAGAIAQDALDAANAATDAALSAAEAADAATAAATEAKESADAATAAVAELSAEVAKLMAALTAKVTTLSTLVAKIAKKVKA